MYVARNNKLFTLKFAIAAITRFALTFVLSAIGVEFAFAVLVTVRNEITRRRHIHRAHDAARARRSVARHGLVIRLVAGSALALVSQFERVVPTKRVRRTMFLDETLVLRRAVCAIALRDAGETKPGRININY